MEKANHRSWQSAWQTKKNKTSSGVAPVKDERALLARFYWNLCLSAGETWRSTGAVCSVKALGGVT